MTAQPQQPNHRKRQAHAGTKSVLRRRRAIEQEAAARTLSGNGRCPDLPPLPVGDGNDGGLGTLFGHPYGALPHGNSLAHPDPSTSPDHVRSEGLGHLRPLNDEQILGVLSFFQGEDLARFVQCSRFSYVAGHHDELWRDLALRNADVEKRDINFINRWRDTFVKQACKRRALPSESFRSHTPMKVLSIYSDTFYRSWLCRSFHLNPSWLMTESVEREQASSLTAERFVQEYEITNKPVIVSGATESWPALSKWNRKYLIEKTRGVTFRATSGAAPLPSTFTMESYARYCDGAVEEAPLYLFDRTFSKSVPHLLEDFVPALKCTCPYLDPSAPHGHDLFSLLGESRRPDYRWIIVGPKRSGSSFHIDPNCTHAWNVPVVGRKLWIFYPPGVNPPGVFPSANGDDVAMPISIGEWFLTYWEEHCKRRDSPLTPQSERPLECTVSPGEILFVPHGWWHSVLNLDDGLSVALTQNYVSSTNLGDVLRFLDSRIGQISGCRDRPEAISPADLGPEFRKALEKSRPDLLETGDKAASAGWNCNAWIDEEQSKCLNKKAKSETTTSILERAKMPGIRTENIEGEEKKDENSIGDGGTEVGFSFSFL